MSRLGTRHLLDDDRLPLFSLAEINRLGQAEKKRIYLQLIPGEIFDHFGIDSESLCNGRGEPAVRLICPRGLSLLRIEVRRDPADKDCVFFAEIADTPYRQIELAFCIINDPDAPRFDIDVDPSGRDNCFGTLRRNFAEELRAMRAGLAPNQVRKGLKLFPRFFERLERFVDSLGIDAIIAEPLSYNNAIAYETFGFDYITGKQLMRWIDGEFQPGGVLFQRLDGSTPFRCRELAKTVRGRSWAIHDGIMGRVWDGVKLYKTIGVDAGIDSFKSRARKT